VIEKLPSGQRLVIQFTGTISVIMSFAMHPRTDATLEELEKADWFSCVGVQDTTTAKVLLSWKQAIKNCSSINWENLCLEAANQYRERLLERSKKRYNQWNETVDQVKNVTTSLARRKIDTIVREHGLPGVFEATVQWDILHVCMEAEYADVYHPGFYASQAYWYVKGHFPCGWEGKFPDGRLVIY
jgi:hypothetical protein